MRSNLIDLEVMIHHETSKAVLVSTDGNRAGAVWLPKAFVEFEEGITIGKAQIITLPEPTAIEKGLV